MAPSGVQEASDWAGPTWSQEVLMQTAGAWLLAGAADWRTWASAETTDCGTWMWVSAGKANWWTVDVNTVGVGQQRFKGMERCGTG